MSFGYALFFMSDAALQYLDTSGGFELGTGPNIVVLDTGAAKGLSTSTVQDGIHAIFFDQHGLMAGLGLQGSKISRIEPESCGAKGASHEVAANGQGCPE